MTDPIHSADHSTPFVPRAFSDFGGAIDKTRAFSSNLDDLGTYVPNASRWRFS